MNDLLMKQISFSAHYIENWDINPEIALNCKMRSKLVHEKIFQSRNKSCGYSVILVICTNGVKVLKSLDQTLISSHAIQRISYSACDRTNRLFALVVRSTGISKSQVCYIFRMETSEEADSINRYFGSIFKQLHNQKKERNSKSALTGSDAARKNVDNYENMSELLNSLNLCDQDSDSGNVPDHAVDPRLRQISTSNINELVSEKRNIRRLSLGMMSTECEDIDLDDHDQPLHPSLEKIRTSLAAKNDVQPLVRRKKPEYKGNRISAAIERWSFRGNRDISSDFLKSGSPVVALKEQLEYEDQLSADSSLGSGSRHENSANIGCIPQSQSKKQLVLPSQSNLCINNDSKPTNNNNVVRKNSAPISTPNDDEQPPVPPVRIHSLRNPTGPRTLFAMEPAQLIRGCGEGASLSMPECNDDEDDDLSSITTPSSCGQEDSEPARLNLYNEPPPPLRIYRDTPKNYPTKELISSPISTSANCQNYSSSIVPTHYFRDFNKEEAMGYLLDKEIGGFLLRYSASHRGCMALSVKVADNLVSHYIIQQTSAGCQMKGLDKTWPNMQALIIHLSVIPEMLPCPIRIVQPPLDRQVIVPAPPPPPTTYFTADLFRGSSKAPHYRQHQQQLPQSQSADDEYQQRMRHFLRDMSSPAQDQYQQLSDFSSIVAGLDFI